MLGPVALRLLVIAPVILLAGAIAGCGSGTAKDTPTYSGAAATVGPQSPPLTPMPTPAEVVSEGAPPLQLAADLRTMLTEFPEVVVGRVIGIEGQYYNYVPAPTGPALGGWPTTVFTFEVQRVVHSNRINPGDNINVIQTGGYLPDGRMYVSSGEGRLMARGTTYLLFLQDLLPLTGLPQYNGPVFGRFVVDNGLVIPNGHECSKAISALSGVSCDERNAVSTTGHLAALARNSLDQASAAISGALAEGPLPTRPGPTATPAPAPTLLPVPVP